MPLQLSSQPVQCKDNPTSRILSNLGCLRVYRVDVVSDCNWGLLGFGLCPSSGILNKKRFRKRYLFPSSDQREGDTYSVGSVRKNVPEVRICRREITVKCTTKIIIIHIQR
jgi:hypothetical protein